jgi:hypothetical protein
MAQVIIDDTNLKNIANAIRKKDGSTASLKPSEMATAIAKMTIGEQVIPDSVFTQGFPNNNYRFYATNMNWLLENYAEYYEPLTLSTGMFMENLLLETIPITLTASNYDLAQVFYNCNNLTEITNFNDEPDSTFTLMNTPTNEMFYHCIRLRTIPNNIFGVNYTTNNYWDEFGESERQAMFAYCYSLRKLPNISGLDDGGTNHRISIYWEMCHDCYALDEAINLPVSRGTYTSNMFSHTFNHANRLKEIKFVVNADGTAKTANWSNQVINLSYYCGYADDYRKLTNYNSGCSGLVNSSSNYNTYKDTEGWYSADYRYSRYNLTSLVNTINTLPDTSAFIATNGGTNTIKLKQDAGKYTDGGAVSDITEEQAAVATAKGWTIAFSDYENVG